MARTECDLLIRGDAIVGEDGTFRGDIAVDGGRTVAIASPSLPDMTGREEIDAGHLHVLPGLVDVHVHCNEPGRTEWEGFATGSRSLAAGGTTTFFDMPLNSTPPTIGLSGLEAKQAAARDAAIIDYGLWAGLVPGNLGQLGLLCDRGVVGFKAFMSNSGIEDFPRVDDDSLLAGMSEIAGLDSILAVHAESEIITEWLTARAAAEGKRSVSDFCATRPVASEIEAVNRVAAYAHSTGCRLHIVHVSSGQVAEYADRWRGHGVDLTVETCPHYLALNEHDFDRLGGLAKCSPPLRSQEHVESLWAALSDGVVDIVASDHSPAPPGMKQDRGGDIFAVWGGISGAQTTLNVLLEEGYFRRGVPLNRLVQVAAAKPAQRFGLYPRKGIIAVGSDADFCLIDLAADWRLEATNLLYRHQHSPFLGNTFRGKVVRTLLRGQTVFPVQNQVPLGRMVQAHVPGGEAARSWC